MLLDHRTPATGYEMLFSSYSGVRRRRVASGHGMEVVVQRVSRGTLTVSSLAVTSPAGNLWRPVVFVCV